MEWGGHEDKMERHKARFKKKGKDISFLSTPELQETVLFVWEMWNTLHSCRPQIQGVAPIPFSEAVSWIDFNCDESYEFDDRTTLMEMFSAVEASYLEHVKGKLKTDKDGNDSDTFLPTNKT